MKIAAFFLASAMWLGVAGSAHAQSMTPEASTKLGDCGYGCLVLVNDSENSDIVGFYIREGHSDRKHGGSVRFVENIFRPQVEAVGVPMGQDFRLYPHKAWWMPLPRSGPCKLRIAVNFRDRATRKVRTGPEGNVNICGPKHADVVFRAKEAPES